MAAQPTLYPEWGTSNITESIDIEGLVVTFASKIEPTAEWKTSGAKYSENTPRQYINWILDNNHSWTKHLDERYSIDDVHLTESTEVAATISTRLGGTWVQRGTQVVGTITAKVWQKTA